MHRSRRAISLLRRRPVLCGDRYDPCKLSRAMAAVPKVVNREAEPLRPTREASAPFVPAPPPPRVAPAPRAAALRVLRATVPAEPPDVAQREREAPTAIVVARFRREEVDRAVAALVARGLRAARLTEAAAGPIGLARELSRALRRATAASTAFGVIGAGVGALVVPSEALVPTLGWLPGPVAGAAFGAGAFGALGFLLGAASLLFAPATKLSLLAEGGFALVEVRGDVSAAMLVAVVSEHGGEPLAHA